jgi:hypothetical protein
MSQYQSSNGVLVSLEVDLLIGYTSGVASGFAFMVIMNNRTRIGNAFRHLLAWLSKH